MRLGTLFLQVFPVMPKTVSTVEYTLTVPTSYAEGSYRVRLDNRFDRVHERFTVVVRPR